LPRDLRKQISGQLEVLQEAHISNAFLQQEININNKDGEHFSFSFGKAEVRDNYTYLTFLGSYKLFYKGIKKFFELSGVQPLIPRIVGTRKVATFFSTDLWSWRNRSMALVSSF
jgi:hypothetical protein